MNVPRPVALAAALTLALAGCAEDGPEPTPAPPPSTSPASASPTPDATPTAAALSPVQTVRAWVEARNDALSNGDTAAVYALSAPDCKTCRDLVEPFAQLYAEGGSVQTDGWTIDNVEKLPNFDTSRQVAAAATFAGGYTLQEPEGEPSSFPEEKHILRFQLHSAAEGWLVAEVVFLP